MFGKRTVVVFSGAGLSAESGIPTFRDGNGLWENHRVEDVASPEGWAADPQLVLDFYAARFKNIQDAQPNEAHKALARLQDAFVVVNISQNIDDLLERAGCKYVQHLHGIITRGKCEHHRDITMLDGDPNHQCDYFVNLTEPIKLGDKCVKCQGQMRPDVVWFGESVPLNFEDMQELAREVKYEKGVFICVGTSGQVQPAGLLISYFSQVPQKYIVDPKARPIANYELRKGNAGVELPKLVDELLAETK